MVTQVKISVNKFQRECMEELLRHKLLTCSSRVSQREFMAYSDLETKGLVSGESVGNSGVYREFRLTEQGQRFLKGR